MSKNGHIGPERGAASGMPMVR
jgi:hypothetical protein